MAESLVTANSCVALQVCSFVAPVCHIVRRRPQTFLKPTGRTEVVKITPHAWGGGGSTLKYTVIEVEPQMA